MDILKQVDEIQKQHGDSTLFSVFVGQVDRAPYMGATTKCPECHSEHVFTCVMMALGPDGKQAWGFRCKVCGQLGVATLRQVSK